MVRVIKEEKSAVVFSFELKDKEYGEKQENWEISPIFIQLKEELPVQRKMRVCVLPVSKSCLTLNSRKKLML